MNYSYEAACREFEHCVETYDFDKATGYLEASERLPEYFARILSERDFRIASEKLESEAQTVASVDTRAEAHRIVNEAAEALRGCPSFISLATKVFRALRTTSLVFADWQVSFEGKSEDGARLLSNIFATQPKPENLADIRRFVDIVTVVAKWVERMSASGKDEAQQNQTAEVLAKALSEVAQGRLSLDALRGSLSALGISLGRKPGRIPRDYSLQYQLRIERRTWTEITRISLEQDPEIREEFRGRSYDDLDFRSQESLKKRLQMGVASFAQRTQKELPAPKSLESES